MNKKNKKVIICFAALLLALAGAAAALGCIYARLPQQTESFDTLTADKNDIKEFEVQDGTLTAMSDDPWIVLDTDVTRDYAGISVDVIGLSDDYTYTDIYTSINDSMSCYSVELHEGENYIEFANVLTGVDYIRLDLLNKKGQQIAVKSVSLNDRAIVADVIGQNIRLIFPDIMRLVLAFALIFAAAAFAKGVFDGKPKKVMAKRTAVMLAAAAAAYFLTITFISSVYNKQRNISLDELISKPNVVSGFDVTGTTLTAVSDDPWIYCNGTGLSNVRTVTVNVNKLKGEDTVSEIFVFYAPDDNISIRQQLKEGANDFVIPENDKKVNGIRLDLTSVNGDKIDVGEVIFNRSSAVRPVIWGEALLVLCRLLLWLFAVIMPFFAVWHGRRVKRLLPKGIVPFAAAIITVITAVLALKLGIVAFIGVYALGFLCGNTQRNANIKNSSLKTAVFVVYNIFIYLTAQYLTLGRLWWGLTGTNALCITVLALCALILCCLIADGSKKAYLSAVFDGAAVLVMTLAAEVLARYYLDGVGLAAAIRLSLSSTVFCLSLVLTGSLYLLLKNLFGGILGRVLAFILYALYFTGNLIKLIYHNSILMPMDVLQLGDFLGIATRYVSPVLFYGGVILLCVLIIAALFIARHKIAKHKPNLIAAFTSLVLLVTVFTALEANSFASAGADIAELWRGTRECVNRCGFVSYSWLKFKEITSIYPKADESYSKERMQQLDNEFKALSPESANAVKPDVILVMEESLFDVQNVQGVNFSMPVDENIKKYYKNTVISPKFGGGTASVEFEALTGFSNYFFLDNIVPYVTYWNNTENKIPSIAEEFNANGYATTAIHPNDGSAYNRDVVYSCMGFNKFMDKDDLDFSPDNVTQDGYFKDDALADVITDELAAENKPEFVFAVTIENHTLYENKYRDTEVKLSSDKLKDNELHPLEQYSQGVLSADRFIAKMVDYVNNAQRPTVLYVWGDHLPALNALGTLGYTADNHNKYGTPLAVYSNYTDSDMGCEYMTPNQLAPQILNDAGIKHSSYFDYIYSLREVYPVIHKEFGIPEDDELIKKYELIQYDLLFGKKYLLGYD